MEPKSDLNQQLDKVMFAIRSRVSLNSDFIAKASPSEIDSFINLNADELFLKFKDLKSRIVLRLFIVDNFKYVLNELEGEDPPEHGGS